ncbi:hypothetical protein FIU97_09410 [Roseivivax sp. THAF40]|uniref:hypothetical protein n=1 Tax=Roseivivax sp. THAF40 TaxID=2587858 RepID=UPI00126888B9|nr:hypothetical protein [Roseivivax sp. THAF40]QFT46788.1 hypothetical protein FIU97_09410 [Roseivivax sp. THAF40]
MATWKKGFRKIPAKLLTKLEGFDERNVRVIAGKVISSDAVDSGLYQHLGLSTDSLEVGKVWTIIPPQSSGATAKKNSEGWTVVRKDLPKFTKYFYQDVPIYGDAARNGWTTAAIPREVYVRDQIPPFLFELEIEVKEQQQDGRYGVVFSITDVLDRDTTSFSDDLLFALNLLQECTGVSDVAPGSSQSVVFTSSLDWELFPPGDLDDLVDRLTKSKDGRGGAAPDKVRERLELFEQFQPTEYLKGMGGNDHYIGAKFADDLVAFENLKYGNALYVLYGDWEQLSQRPRSELLKLTNAQFDRIVHRRGWELEFAKLMQTELRQRGIRIRIGRNVRRRQAH